MANDLDYKLKLGYDASELERGQRESVKKMAKVQETLSKLYRVELTLLKKGTSERQSQLAVMQQQLRIQQKINSLQGKPTVAKVAPRATPVKQPKDPDSNISYQARASLQERIKASGEGKYAVTDTNLQAKIAKARVELRKLHEEVGSTKSQRSLIRMRIQYGEIQREISSAVREQRSLNRAMDKGNVVASKFGGTLKSFALSFASAYAAIGVGKEIYRIGKEFDAMQAGLLAASDGAEAAKENFTFLMDTSKRLGTDVESGVRGFNRLAVSMKGAKFGAEDIKHVFSAAQEATATFQLSADKSNLVMLAMSQMASKGKQMPHYTVMYS